MKVRSDDVILQWLIRWAAMLPSRLLVGKDYTTAYERRRGRKCNIATEKFGEYVWYRELRSKTEAQEKMKTDWHEGVWLGHNRDSNEVLIGTDNGVVKAFAVRKKPKEEQWNGERIKHMKGTPARPNPRRVGAEVPVHVRFGEEFDDEEPPAVVLRRV